MIEYKIKGISTKVAYLIDTYFSVENNTKRHKVAITNSYETFYRGEYDVYDVSDDEFKTYFKCKLKDKLNNIVKR